MLGAVWIGGRVGRLLAHRSTEDRDDVVADVNERLVKVFSRRGGIGGTPLGVVVHHSVDWAVADFLRDRGRRETAEVLVDPAELPQAWQEEVSAVEQAHGLVDILAGLSPREREVVFERAVLELDPLQVAERHGISRGAVDTAYSRALSKLRRTRQ